MPSKSGHTHDERAQVARRGKTQEKGQGARADLPNDPGEPRCPECGHVIENDFGRVGKTLGPNAPATAPPPAEPAASAGQAAKNARRRSSPPRSAPEKSEARE